MLFVNACLYMLCPLATVHVSFFVGRGLMRRMNIATLAEVVRLQHLLASNPFGLTMATHRGEGIWDRPGFGDGGGGWWSTYASN